MEKHEIYGISLTSHRPQRHQDCGQQKLVWPVPHWHGSHRLVCADDALQGSTRWTPSYSCSAAIDDFTSIGRYLEHSSTVGLVERLIMLVVASRMSVHRQRIGVDTDDEQWPTSGVQLCRWWRGVVRGLTAVADIHCALRAFKSTRCRQAALKMVFSTYNYTLLDLRSRLDHNSYSVFNNKLS